MGRLRVGTWRGSRGGIDPGCFQDLAGEQQELVGVELFGPSTGYPPQELFELMLELFIQASLSRQRLQQLANELMAGLQISGKFRW